MKRFIHILVISAVSLTAFTLNAQLKDLDNWEARYTNGIAAVVNNEIITVESLKLRIKPLVPRIREKTTSKAEFDKELESISHEILQSLIDRILIVDDFNEKGFQIPKVYVENEYDEYIAKEFNNDRRAFHQWLSTEGKTPLKFRDELKNKMIVDYMHSQMRRSQSAVSPAKIQKYYEENKSLFYDKNRAHIRQIMLAPYTKESPELLMQEANNIITELNNGAAFSELARKYSQDEKAKIGGDWGWIEPGELAPELEQLAFSLPEGSYSQPVLKEGFIFILYVVERHEEGIQPLNKVREQIEETLSGQLAAEARDVWINRLRKDAYIKFYL